MTDESNGTYVLRSSTHKTAAVRHPDDPPRSDAPRSIPIRDHTLEVESAALAGSLTETYEHLSVEKKPATDTCGALMTDGRTCERPAGDCPYHTPTDRPDDTGGD